MKGLYKVFVESREEKKIDMGCKALLLLIDVYARIQMELDLSPWSKHIKKKSRHFTNGFDSTGGNYLHFYFLGILHCEFDNICRMAFTYTP